MSNDHSELKDTPDKSEDLKKSQQIQKEIKKVRALKASVRLHSFGFVLVNGFLFALNFLFTPMLLWAAFPLFGWMIGLGVHVSTVVTRKVKPLIRSAIIHLTAYGFTIMLLCVINYLVSQTLDWALIVAFFWGVGLLAHIGFIAVYKPGDLKIPKPHLPKPKIPKLKTNLQLMKEKIALEKLAQLEQQGILDKEKALKKRERLMNMQYEPETEVIETHDPIPGTKPTKTAEKKGKKKKDDSEPKPLSEAEKKELIKTEKEINVKKRQFICLVHKGPVAGANIYLCPNCDAIYCMTCATSLKEKGEKCWSCEQEFEL